MTRKLDEALVERTARQYPDIDVYLVAGVTREIALKGNLQNPNGLFVSMVKKRADAAVRRIGSPEHTAEQGRYAQFWFELMRMVAQEGASPMETAHCLEVARRDGFPAVNPQLIELLLAHGESWRFEP